MIASIFLLVNACVCRVGLLGVYAWILPPAVVVRAVSKGRVDAHGGLRWHDMYVVRASLFQLQLCVRMPMRTLLVVVQAWW